MTGRHRPNGATAIVTQETCFYGPNPSRIQLEGDAPHSVWIPFLSGYARGRASVVGVCVASVLDGAIDRRVNTDGN
jgi:hypothetical protein